MNAKEYLNIALGGNMNVGTLKPLAIEEIMDSYAKHCADQKEGPSCSVQATGFKQIQEILIEESNQLAYVLDNGKTDAALKDAGFPHRVEISIRREIKRLRELAALAEEASN